jgi:hypothetical protein
MLVRDKYYSVIHSYTIYAKEAYRLDRLEIKYKPNTKLVLGVFFSQFAVPLPLYFQPLSG